MKTGNTGTSLTKNKLPSNSSLLACTFTSELPAERTKRIRGMGEEEKVNRERDKNHLPHWSDLTVNFTSLPSSERKAMI